MLATTLLLIAAGAPASAAASSFADLPPTHQAHTAGEYLRQNGLVTGFALEDGSTKSAEFRPEATLSRAEFLKIALLAGGVAPEEACEDFTDSPKGAWENPYVCWAAQNGVARGYADGRFAPHSPVYARDGAKMLAQIFGVEVAPAAKSEAWEAPFVAALAAEGAWPSDMPADAPMTRGQMAQMLHAAITGARLDLPKNSPVFRGCAAVSAAAARAQRPSFGFQKNRLLAQPMLAQDAAESAVSAEAGVAGSASQTNTAQRGVDEIDIVKVSSAGLFMVSQEDIVIISPDGASELARITPQNGSAPLGILLAEDRLTVFSTHWKHLPMPMPEPILPMPVPMPEPFLEEAPTEQVLEAAVDSAAADLSIEPAIIEPAIEPAIARMAPPFWHGESGEVVLAEVFDVSSPREPTRVATHEFSGNFIDARMTKSGAVVVATRSWSGLPRKFPCADVAVLPRPSGAGAVTLSRFYPQKTFSNSPDTEVIFGLGHSAEIYLSANNAYLVAGDFVPRFRPMWGGGGRWHGQEMVDILRVPLDANQSFRVASSGRVAGRSGGAFGISEFDGALRVATHGQRGEGSRVSTLSADTLAPLGVVEGIAPGEDMKSVRFADDIAYMVTFENVDPLFVIDLQNPKNPRIIGELKIPGWSDYLHPLAVGGERERFLLGLGRDVLPGAEDDGRISWNELGGIKLSLFDVSDLSNPREASALVLGNRDTNTEATHNHRALLISLARGILAFPISSGNFSGGAVFSVAADGSKIEKRAEMTNAEPGLSPWGSAIRRFAFLGDRLFAISDSAVATHDFETLERQHFLRLRQPRCHEYQTRTACEAAAPQCQPRFRGEFCTAIGVCTPTGDFVGCSDS